MRNTYLIVGIIVVLIAIIAFAIIRNRLPQLKQIGKASPTPTVEVKADSLSINRHTPASTAVVDKVTLAKPGFVVIHDQQDGKLGGVLGASELLSAGDHQNIVIKLSRKTEDGEQLFAVLHIDNGDGTFDPATDEVDKDKDSNPIQMAFQITKAASTTSSTPSTASSGFQIPATGLGEDDQ